MSDFPVELIQATVQVDQRLPSGPRTVGTGFLVASATASGEPRTILITAKHVLDGMPGPEANIGYRITDAEGRWRYAPKPLRIRDETGAPLWTAHPARDVAAMVVQAPPEFAQAAIPAGYMVADDAYAERNISPGEELMVLGFPRGIAANNAGFPILRSGKVASYPVSPTAFPTFLLDFSVFPGNSGGPVFISRAGPLKAGTGGSRPFIAGLLTQQVEMDDERLEIGIVTHSKYIVETLALMGDIRAPVTIAQDEQLVRGAEPAAETPKPPSLVKRTAAVLREGASWVETTFVAPFRLVGLRLASWIAPNWSLARAEDEPERAAS